MRVLCESAGAADHCLGSASALECTARTAIVWEAETDRFGREISSTKTRTGGEGICLSYPCLYCAVELFLAYFSCAVGCTQDKSSYSCIDCSFSYSDVNEELHRLREKLWEAHFLLALDAYVRRHIDSMTSDARARPSPHQRHAP